MTINKLNQCKTGEAFLSFLNLIQPKKIGRFGGRRFSIPDQKQSFSMNQLVKHLDRICKTQKNDPVTQQVIKKLNDLDKKANKLLDQTSAFSRQITKIKSWLGQLRFDHSKILDNFQVLTPSIILEKVELDKPLIEDLPKLSIADLNDSNMNKYSLSELFEYADFTHIIIEKDEEKKTLNQAIANIDHNTMINHQKLTLIARTLDSKIEEDFKTEDQTELRKVFKDIKSDEKKFKNTAIYIFHACESSGQSRDNIKLLFDALDWPNEELKKEFFDYFKLTVKND